jgi:hypothetical protein
MSMTAVGIGSTCDFDLLSKIARAFDGIAIYAHDHKSIIDSIKYLCLMILRAVENFTHVLGDRSGQTQILSHKLCSAINLFITEKETTYYNDFAKMKADGANDRLIEAMRESKDIDEIEKALKRASDAKCWGWKYIQSLWFSYRYNVPLNSRDKSGALMTSNLDKELLANFDNACILLSGLPTNLILNWQPKVDMSEFETREEYFQVVNELVRRAQELKDERSLDSSMATLTVDNACRGGCFDINAMVAVKKHGVMKFVPAKNLRAGDMVFSTNNLLAEIETIFITEDSVLERTKLMNTNMESLEITSRHPILNRFDSRWIYPKDSPDALINTNAKPEPMTVGTIMLTEQSMLAGCVSVLIKGGFEVITAGHDIVGDAIAEHCFFGNRKAMLEYKQHIISRFPDRYNNVKGILKINEQSISIVSN